MNIPLLVIFFMTNTPANSENLWVMQKNGAKNFFCFLHEDGKKISEDGKNIVNENCVEIQENEVAPLSTLQYFINRDLIELDRMPEKNFRPWEILNKNASQGCANFKKKKMQLEVDLEKLDSAFGKFCSKASATKPATTNETSR